MSDTHSNHDPEADGFSDLESKLKSLEPSPIKPDFLAELEQDLKRTRQQGRREKQIMVSRFVPLAAAACFLVLGYLTIQLGFFAQTETGSGVAGSQPGPATPASPGTAAPVADPSLVHGLPPRSREDRFVPVSAQEYLRNTSTGRVFQVEGTGGFAREVNLEFEDVYHWHDPETSTNIRVITPRAEKIVIPVPVN